MTKAFPCGPTPRAAEAWAACAVLGLSARLLPDGPGFVLRGQFGGRPILRGRRPPNRTLPPWVSGQ
eukprot:5562838-Lingulodinium_polyedra.AAC.1